jgi:hypothetical protein
VTETGGGGGAFTALAKRSWLGALVFCAAAGAGAGVGGAAIGGGGITPALAPRGSDPLVSERFPNIMGYFPNFKELNLEKRPPFGLTSGARPVKIWAR